MSYVEYLKEEFNNRIEIMSEVEQEEFFKKILNFDDFTKIDIDNEAYKKGFKEGKQFGYEEGYEDGYQDCYLKMINKL